MAKVDEAQGNGIDTDLATGKPINTNPEERVRQQYEKILKEDYGYEYESMDIEVQIAIGGNSGKRSPPPPGRHRSIRI